MGFLQLAEWYVESVAAQAKDADFFRHAAHVHERNEHWHKAIASWEQVKKLDPNDESSSRQINALSASATIKRAGLEESLEKRATPAAEGADDMAAKLERLKQEQLSPEDRWQKEIQENPNQVWPYLNMAEQFRNRSQLEAAEKILGQGLKANPKEPMLQQAYADVQMTRMKKAIDTYTQCCKDRPEDMASRAKLDQLTKLLSDYEIKEFRRRVGRQPGRHEPALPARPLPGAGRAARRGHRRVSAGPFQPDSEGAGAAPRRGSPSRPIAPTNWPTAPTPTP